MIPAMTKNPGPANSQSGITLLLTVILISAIAIISVTVAFFVVQEIRNARSSKLTEPAIIAAETAGEQGVYMIKRGAFNTACNVATYTQLSGAAGGTTNTRIKKCIGTEAVTFQVSAAEPKTVYLYDPANINGNTCMEQDLPCNANGQGAGARLFEDVTITHETGSFNLNIEIVTLDGLPYVSDIISPGGEETYDIAGNIVGSNDERLAITLAPTSGTVTVTVRTSGIYDGLPAYQTVDAEGCVGVTTISDCNSSLETYKRRINVTVPR
jgi:hypothetical protein